MAQKTNDSQDSGNVISFQKHRGQKPKLSSKHFIRILAEEIMDYPGRAPSSLLPSALKVKACPLDENNWDLVLLDEQNKTYTFVTEQVLIAYISEYLAIQRTETESLWFDDCVMELSTDQKKEVIREIFYRSKVYHDEIKNWAFVGQKSDSRWCLCRLPFDIEACSWDDLAGKAYTAFSFLDRIDRPDIFCSFIYESLMGLGSRKKALWVRGPADTLKTSAIETIGSLLGQAFASISDSHFEDGYRWLISELAGKMLTLIDDADPKITNWTQWKTVTGCSVAASERKGKDLTQVKLTTRLAVTSNFPPAFDGSSEEQLGAQKTRLLYCQIRPTPTPPRSSAELQAWKNAFLGDLPYLLGYGKACSEAGVEPVDFSGVLDDSEAYQYLQYFRSDPNGQIIGADLVDWCKSKGLNSQKQRREIKAMLSREFGATEIRTRTGLKLRGVKLYLVASE